MSNVASKVIETVKHSGITLLPNEIASRANLNHNTVRRVVRELVAAGLLVEAGIYCGRTTYGLATTV